MNRWIVGAMVGLGVAACSAAGGGTPDREIGGVSDPGNRGGGVFDNPNTDPADAIDSGGPVTGGTARPVQPPPSQPMAGSVAVAGPGEDCPPGMLCVGTDPDPGDCGTVRFETEVEVVMRPGNVLLVFDRSGSMGDPWENQQRWQVAGEAVNSALSPLASNLTLGAVFFPSPDPNAGMAPCVDPTGIACIFVPGLTVGGVGTCVVNQIDAADQLQFAPAAMSLAAMTGSTPPLFSPVTAGGTPLLDGLRAADSAINAGSLTGVTSVVVITDGSPNCNWNAAAADQVVANWAAQGIRTYVIGLPGSGQADQVLNSLAATGGTGTFLNPNDPATLEAELRSIAQDTVRSGFDSCEIALNPATEVPDKLRLIVTVDGQDRDVPRQLGANAGWQVTPTGDMVTLEGDLCRDAMAGAYQELRFEFSCKEIPPLPPPQVF